jgi:hypothetical protein
MWRAVRARLRSRYTGAVDLLTLSISVYLLIVHVLRERSNIGWRRAMLSLRESDQIEIGALRSEVAALRALVVAMDVEHGSEHRSEQHPGGIGERCGRRAGVADQAPLDRGG